jgi:hypothetical protein
VTPDVRPVTARATALGRRLIRWLREAIAGLFVTRAAAPSTTGPKVLPKVELAQVPSLPVVEAALARAEDSYRARANSLDTKAGTILSAAGVIVALVGIHSSVAGVVGQIGSILAGAAAVWTIMPRVDKAIVAQEIFNAYLQQPEVSTRLILLSTQLPLQAGNEARLFTKAHRLRLAALLLLGSATAIAIGGILNDIWH